MHQGPLLSPTTVEWRVLLTCRIYRKEWLPKMQDEGFLWKLHCLSTHRGISPIVKDHTHQIENITLAQACKWMVVYILSLAIIHLNVFMPSKYITLNNFIQQWQETVRNSTMYLTSVYIYSDVAPAVQWVCTGILHLILIRKKYFLIFFNILNFISNYFSFNILTFHCNVCILIVYICTKWPPVPLVIKLYNLDWYPKTIAVFCLVMTCQCKSSEIEKYIF